MSPVIVPELRYGRLWMSLCLCLVLVVTVLSLLPTEKLPEVPGFLTDKVNHMVAFLGLALAFAGVLVRRLHLWMALALVAFGVLIELLQGVMALGRESEWLDLRADAIGIVAGLLLALTPIGRWAQWSDALLARTMR